MDAAAADTPEPAQDDAEPVAAVEEPQGTAERLAVERAEPPGIPIVHTYRSFITNYRARPDGGMEVVFTPAAASSSGAMAMPPQVVFVFGTAQGWEAFRAEIAADGVKQAQPQRPLVARASVVMPPGVND